MPTATKKPSEGIELPEKRRRGRYPVAIRRDIAALVLDQGRTVKDVCEEFSLNAQSVGNWVRAEKVERGERAGLIREEKEELASLKRQVKHRDNGGPGACPQPGSRARYKRMCCDVH